ncbi:MAG TPA: ATP-binding protein [Elusimicrobiales bacterium]|nr:ATP-binding protein [Elusimicrobiales bacterium]
MVSLKELRLKHKLVAIQLATACAVLLLYAAFTFLNDQRAFRNSVVSQLASTAGIIGGNSVSALDFADPAAAGKLLASLAAEPDIVHGCIYDREGRVFASYLRAGSSEPPPSLPDGESHQFSGGHVSLSRKIVRDGEVLGAILLHSEMKQYRRAMVQNAVMALGLLLLGLALAFPLSMLAQRPISGPILELVAAAKKISGTGNYSVRVEKQGSDEIGTLCDAFNEMLAQVEQREASLQEAHRVLDDRVLERTAELRAAKEKLEAIFEAATSGILMVKDRSIVHCNHMIYELFGYAPGEIIGHKTSEGYLDASVFKAIGEEVASCQASGAMFFKEMQLVRKDKSLFWGRITAQFVDKTDPAKGLVAIVADITAEREKSEALKNALEAAKSADQLKSAFLATMSHELRTPLNSIIGFSGILLQELPGALNPEQKKQLGMVSGSAEHLLALINDVLDISKIEAGQLQVVNEPFDLREALHKAVLTARPLADKKGLALEEEVAPEVGIITADRRRMEQVFLNLLSNAIKFTDRGSVRIDCALQAGQVSIRVTDSGIGVRQEDMINLFKPFRQVDTGTTRQYEGTGLGLSICKKLVELMGGAIKGESEWGKGSTFIVTLPASR